MHIPSSLVPHPTALLTAAALAVTVLPACDDGAPAAPCGSAPGSATRGIAVDSLVQHWDWADDTGVASHPAAVDCATYTIESPSSDWHMTGTTPAKLDLAPGSYIVELDWNDGGCSYTSEPVEVEVVHGVVDLVVPLCVDLSGAWRCDDLHKTWEAQVEMSGSCRASFEGISEDLLLDGHLVEAAGVRGIVDRGGQVLEANADAREVTCTRVD